MECKYFGECGACRVYEFGYEAQLQQKVLLNKERFAEFFCGDIEVFESLQENYRARREFKICHDGD
jgi:tRNA (uracil-5-)-methyltransferase